MQKRLQLSSIFLLAIAIALLAGCKDSPAVFKPIDSLIIPDGFNYRTTELLRINHAFGVNFPSIPVALYASQYAIPKENQAIADLLVGYGTTDSQGTLEIDVTVPLSFSYLVLKPGYIGLPPEIRIPINSSKAVFSRYSSREPSSGYTFATLPTRDLGNRIQGANSSWWLINDGYTNFGKPESAVTVTVEDTLLKDINNSVFRYHREKSDDPDFIKSLEVGRLDFNENVDVWLTFIHDTASFSNTLGYYTYTTEDGPPSEVLKENVTIAFPNASYLRPNRGALASGDSVYIGKMEGGTSLGFVLIANGWFAGTGSNPVGRVRDSGHQGIFYSEYAYNLEETPDGKKHAAIIYHEREQIFLIGMEDNRHTATSYNFNDVLFAAVVKNVAAIGNRNTIPSIKSDVDNDRDKDGVIDSLDAYPDDPTRTTLETVTGTLAYEDLWPMIGDYDFNDLVIGYIYNIDGNASNEIVSVDLTYKIIASGAGYPNGLALSLPLNIDAYEVSLLTYSVSAQTSTAVVTEYPPDTQGSRILIFKTQNDVMQYASKPNPFNTGDNIELEPQSVSFSITFNTPISREVLGAVPYDVFMLIDNAESDTKPEEKANREVHLTDYPPTPLANPIFFNTHQDTTDVNEERYYKSANNLPWAIHIPGEWEHPLERKTIIDGYNYFGAWAESGGSRYPDWYQAKPNHKNTKNLYRK